MQIKISKTLTSSISSVDFDNIPFGRVFADHMFIADFKEGKWQNFEIKPLEPLSVHPGNLAWHYGQSIFEGMKASATKEGIPILFRPEMHIKRLNASAIRMCMPEFPEEVFIDAISKLVLLEKNWIPKSEGSALYLRPLMFACDEALGVRASDTYKLVIFCLPVGPYYNKPVSLLAEQKYVRAVDGGVGEAKTAGNYAASLYPAKLAKEAGYDQVMWLDAKEFKYIQEVGTMNIFFVIDGEVLTPATSGSILKGITRDSIITILESKGYKVTERNITIDEICEAYDKGLVQEVFGAGTAAVVANVDKMKIGEKIMNFDVDSYAVAPLAKSQITGLRDGSIPDDFGWRILLKETVSV